MIVAMELVKVERSDWDEFVLVGKFQVFSPLSFFLRPEFSLLSSLPDSPFPPHPTNQYLQSMDVCVSILSILSLF